MFTAGMSEAGVLADIQSVLGNLRSALDAVNRVYSWSSGIAGSDLVTLGFSSADATALLSAMNDAHAIAQIYSTGQPPGTYPQAASAYPYSASQSAVIGPRT